MKHSQQYTVKHSPITTSGFFLLEVMVALCIAIMGTYYSTTWYLSIVKHLNITRTKRALLYGAVSYLEVGKNPSANCIITEETIQFPHSVEIGGNLCTVPDWFLVKKVTLQAAVEKQFPPVMVTLTRGCINR